MALKLETRLLRERLAISELIDVDLSPFVRLPTAVTWNRLEGRPRSNDLTRPMRAEVRDPLWMLARQWQLGEFDGEDAGTPVQARMLTETTPAAAFALDGGPPRILDQKIPLEVIVERQPVEADLMMSLYIGQRWVTQMGDLFGADPLTNSFRNAYRMKAPPHAQEVLASGVLVADAPAAPADASPPGDKDLRSLQLATARRELTARLALAGRGIDGARLLQDVRTAVTSGRLPSDVFADAGVVISDGQVDTVNDRATKLAERWLSQLFVEPGADEDAWVAEHLEHNFSVFVPHADGVTKLTADEYPGGRLDWYSFDAVESEPIDGVPAAEPVSAALSFVPIAVQFAGAPNVRWWEFEERRVGFGLTTASKTDLIKMLLTQFGLVFSNDWFLIPSTVHVGTVVETKGITVTDNFGFNTLVEPTAKRQIDLGLAGSWGMWTLVRRGEVQPDVRFLLAPALARSLESRPVDEVVFLRDEIANLVWAIETIIPDALGGGRDGRVAAKLLREAIRKAYPPPVFEELEDVLFRYALMGAVPENWIPFVAVKRTDENTSTAFLQGAMPRVPQLAPAVEGGEAALGDQVVLPRGNLLARDPVANPNLIAEEELLREGAVVTRSYQRTRWHDGQTFTWAARRKLAGRGEGSSGLAFDQAIRGKAPE
jgi:hypothetical protein